MLCNHTSTVFQIAFDHEFNSSDMDILVGCGRKGDPGGDLEDRGRHLERNLEIFLMEFMSCATTVDFSQK